MSYCRFYFSIDSRVYSDLQYDGPYVSYFCHSLIRLRKVLVKSIAISVDDYRISIPLLPSRMRKRFNIQLSRNPFKSSRLVTLF